MRLCSPSPCPRRPRFKSESPEWNAFSDSQLVLCCITATWMGIGVYSFRRWWGSPTRHGSCWKGHHYLRHALVWLGQGTGNMQNSLSEMTILVISIPGLEKCTYFFKSLFFPCLYEFSCTLNFLSQITFIKNGPLFDCCVPVLKDL